MLRLVLVCCLKLMQWLLLPHQYTTIKLHPFIKTMRYSWKLKRISKWATDLKLTVYHVLFSKVKNEYPCHNKINLFGWLLHRYILYSQLQAAVWLPDLICVVWQSADPKGTTEGTYCHTDYNRLLLRPAGCTHEASCTLWTHIQPTIITYSRWSNA